MADWKERLGMVYSTNPDFEYNCGEVEEEATLPPAQQKLRVWRDTKGRGGKVATIVRGFVGFTRFRSYAEAGLWRGWLGQGRRDYHSG